MGYDSSAGTGTAWTAVKALPAVSLTSGGSSGSASAGASSTSSSAVKPSGSAGTGGGGGGGGGGSTSGGVSVRVGRACRLCDWLVVGVLWVGVGLLV